MTLKQRVKLGLALLVLAALAFQFGPSIMNRASVTRTYRLHASYETGPRGVDIHYSVSGGKMRTITMRKATAGDWEQDVIYRTGTGGILLDVTADNRDWDVQTICSITELRGGLEVRVVARGDGTNDAPAVCNYDTLR